jgi:tetratricopeptide (TPR) repeat protein
MVCRGASGLIGLSCPRLFVVALLLLAFWTRPVVGAPDARAKAEARALFKQAEIKFSLGAFDQALPLYEKAYELAPLPGFLFNIGQCHKNLGRCDKAIFFYRQYLVRMPSAPNRDAVERLIAGCGQARAPQAKPPETTGLKASAREASAPAAAGHPADTQRSTAPKRGSQRGRGLHPGWFWGAVGLTGALLVTGAITGTVAMSSSDEFKDPQTTVARRWELKDPGEALATTSNVTFALGAVAAVGTAVLFFFTEFGSEETHVAAAPLQSGGAAVMLQGRFW